MITTNQGFCSEAVATLDLGEHDFSDFAAVESPSMERFDAALSKLNRSLLRCSRPPAAVYDFKWDGSKSRTIVSVCMYCEGKKAAEQWAEANGFGISHGVCSLDECRAKLNRDFS